MAKTRKNRSRRGGSGIPSTQNSLSTSANSVTMGGKRRRRRGGQMDVYGTTNNAVNSVENTASDLLTGIGSGISNVWNSTKKAVSDLGSTVSGNTPAAPSVAMPGYGGRRKRRGGNGVTPFSGKNAATGAGLVGGSRRRRRGGQVKDFDSNWNKYGSVKGGSRRRRRH
jgi:hypothetical protein